MKNLTGLMKQAQQLQEKMQNAQTELEQLQVEGTAGGGLVRVTLTGKGELTAVKIDPSLLKPEEAEIVEDLVVAAHADAKSKAEAAAAEKMSELTGGLQLPPGFSMPGF